MLIKFFLIAALSFALDKDVVPDGYSVGSSVVVSIISKKKADQLFEEFRKRPEIPFNFPIDGCYARATAMTQIADKQKIEMARIYVHGLLQVATGQKLYPEVRWGYHVAPVAYVEVNGKPELMVFDPSLFSKPVTVLEWKRKMLAPGTSEPYIGETYFGSKYQLNPKLAEGKANGWDPEKLELASEKMAAFSEITRSTVRAFGFEWGSPIGDEQVRLRAMPTLSRQYKAPTPTPTSATGYK